MAEGKRICCGARRLFAAFLVTTVLLFPLPRPSEAAAALPMDDGAGLGCQYQLSFKTLHDMIPDVVGDCLIDEHSNVSTGDTLQETTRGLLVWRRADNVTTFTVGANTWVNGPYGLQVRLKTDRFPWELSPVAAIPTASVTDGTVTPSRFSSSRLAVSTFAGSAQYQRYDVDGPDILFHRYYVSDLQTIGSFGPRWTQEFDIRLGIASPDGTRVEARYPIGTSSTFVRNSDGTFANADRGFIRLARDARTGVFALTMTDDFVWRFDARGLPTALEAPDGFAFVATYNTNGRVSKITDTRTRHALNLTYDPGSGRLATVSDWHSPPWVVRYAYDERGHLQSVTDPDGGVITYRYSGDTTLLTAVVDSRGKDSYAFTWDDQSRVIAEQNQTDLTRGHTKTFRYLARDDGTRTTILTQPATPGTTFDQDLETTFDQQGLILKQVLHVAPGFTRTGTYTYDAHNLLTSSTDQQGLVTTFCYDVGLDGTPNPVQRGRLMRRIDPPSSAGGPAQVTLFLYDIYGRITTIVPSQRVVVEPNPTCQSDVTRSFQRVPII